MFGFGIPNTQILADVYAEKTGAVVVAPDILEGACVAAATFANVREC